VRRASNTILRASPAAAQYHRAWLAALLCTLALCACGRSAESTAIGTQPWGAYEVSVEIRPSPPRPGHNEVVVIVSGEHHRPIYDALVSLRAQASDPWVQAIEDGHVGVYRRAVKFMGGPATTLEVQLQRSEESSAVLRFPVQILDAR